MDDFFLLTKVRTLTLFCTSQCIVKFQAKDVGFFCTSVNVSSERNELEMVLSGACNATPTEFRRIR